MHEFESPERELRRLTSAHHGQWLYLFGAQGVVYSETQNRFAGLDAAGVSAYRAFDAGASIQDLRQFHDSNHSHLTSVNELAIVHALWRGIFPAEPAGAGLPALQNPLPADIEIDGIPISLEYSGKLPGNLCRDLFKNCVVSEAPARCHLSAYHRDDGWTICRNGEEILSSLQDEQLELGFLHATRSLLYDEAEYDVAFHAAMIANEDSGIMFCAPREAGKSTLAAYLIAHGFQLLTDEPALLHLETRSVSSLRLPLSLKEGSWSVLKEQWPHLAATPIHIRSDGAKIRLLHAPPEVVSTRSARLTHIVFPEFATSSTTETERLSPFCTLSLLNEGGMLLAKHLVRDTFEAFLKLVCRTPAFRVRYSSLNEAGRVIQRLISETQDLES